MSILYFSHNKKMFTYFLHIDVLYWILTPAIEGGDRLPYISGVFILDTYELTSSYVIGVFWIFPFNRNINFFDNPVNDGKYMGGSSCSGYVNLPVFTSHLVKIFPFYFPDLYTHDAVFGIGY